MLKLFLDLDGTLAKFNSKKNALKRFDNEKGFFSSLKPYKNIEIINELATCGNVEVYVISATPNEQADQDKMVWINTYLKDIKQENICFCRLNENKAKVIKDKLNIKIDKECILLDDYTKNLIEWKNLNGIGIKRLTSKADNSRKIWKDYSIKNLNQLPQVLFSLTLANE
jgi:5'(3')-deoxyribonucleotidase